MPTGLGRAPGPSRTRPAAPHGLAPWGTGGLDHSATTPSLGRSPTRKAIVDVLCPAPSRCRHVHGPRAWRAPTSCTATPSPTPPPEERPNGFIRTRWANHPAALRLGTQMGSDSPGQHEYIFSSKSHALLPKTIRDTPEGGS
jgi:hypothetical protein